MTIKKLHLGCGQNYLDGYINIDFPLDNHTVQIQSVADVHEDIAKLKFPLKSILEVRLHHVFEHFRRPQILAMLISWNTWMVEGGVIHIEVPDLGRISRVFINPFTSFKRRAVAERHLFGSHEANWAAHYEGYDEKILIEMLKICGFKVFLTKRTSWRGTSNIHLKAKKIVHIETNADATLRASKYLKYFLVDRSHGELEMLKVWMDKFQSQLVVSGSFDE